MTRASSSKLATVLYRELLRAARFLDELPAAKALLVVPDLTQGSTIAEEVFGSRCFMTPICMEQSLQQQVRQQFRKKQSEESSAADAISFGFTVMRELNTKISAAEVMRLAEAPLHAADASIGPAKLLRKPVPGSFLISHPSMCCRHFSRSVVLVTQCDSRGSAGYVVNKPLRRAARLQERITISGTEAAKAAALLLSQLGSNSVRLGGPVRSLQFIHTQAVVGGLALCGDSEAAAFAKQQQQQQAAHNVVWVGGDLERANAVMQAGRASPKDFSMFIGASTWMPGQLEAELDAGDWVIASARPSLALGAEPELWGSLLVALGGGAAEMTRLPAVDVHPDDDES
jgi:putative transcriptional regulator